MKFKLQLLIGLPMLLCVITTKAQVFNFTVNNNGQCYSATGNTAFAVQTASAPAAVSYSWTVFSSNTLCAASVTVAPGTGTSALISFPCCGNYTISHSAFTAGPNPTLILSVQQIYTVSCLASPTITISASTNSICLGQSASFTANGAVSYTWSNSIPFASILVSPLSNTCYSVAGAGANGCVGYASTCLSVTPTPTITVTNSANNLCFGTTSTLTANGATSYTWIPINQVGNTAVVIPNANTCYTVIGSNGNGCNSSTSTCINVLPSPTIAAVASLNNQCIGTTNTLIASGAISYVWSTGSSLSSILVTPTTSSCYTVNGVAANGCSGIATVCINALPNPTINAVTSTMVCLGSGATLTASGGSSYLWNTLATTASIAVIPTVTTIYTVTGTHTLNTCTSMDTVAVFINSLCAIVWPGDANRDGVVNTSDVFELGFAASSTGPARSPASITWNGQYASAWTGMISTGWNKCHADCNGDGTVNGNDTSAINANFSLTHSFKGSAAANNDISLVPQYAVAYAGIWNKADVMLGDAANSISQLYGVSFELNYDKTMIQTDSIKIVYTSSFLNASNQNINFGKTLFNSGKFAAATVRTNQNNVSGNGKIAELWYKVKSGLPLNSTIALSASSAVKINNAAVSETLGVAAPVSLNISTNLVGLSKNVLLDKLIRFYPNPATNNLTLQNDLSVKTVYRIYDITGRIIASGEFTSFKVVDISSLESGNYILEFESEGSKMWKKLLIE
jgi:hypothetical protein